VLERDRDIAMVFQNYALYPHMTVAQNIAFSLKLSKRPRQEIRERVQETAKLLGLEELLDRRPKQLSGGQKQRVAMGRAIIRQPQVFLMDEPLSNLDAQLRVHMRGEIEALQKRLEVTTVYVTHDQVEAMTMGDRVAVLQAGELQQIDTPRHLTARQPLRRRVHRLPADEPRQATLEAADGDLVVGSGSSIPSADLARERRARRGSAASRSSASVRDLEEPPAEAQRGRPAQATTGSGSAPTSSPSRDAGSQRGHSRGDRSGLEEVALMRRGRRSARPSSRAGFAWATGSGDGEHAQAALLRSETGRRSAPDGGSSRPPLDRTHHRRDPRRRGED
jgi:ABC-type nitrate/sulfonate/bicarbonate transport system ATPase subunit